MQKIIKKLRRITYSYIQNCDLFIFVLITFLTPSLLIEGQFGINPPNWWQSISAAYYCNTKALFISMLIWVAFFLFISNNWIYKIASYAVMGIILFPTYEEPLGISTSVSVGLFNLPIALSGNIHIIFNFLLFLCIIAILIETIIKEKYYKLLLLFIPIIISLLAIIIENNLHCKGDWSLHWTTIISEWILFQSAALIFLKRAFTQTNKLKALRKTVLA